MGRKLDHSRYCQKRSELIKKELGHRIILLFVKYVPKFIETVNVIPSTEGAANINNDIAIRDSQDQDEDGVDIDGDRH